MNVGLPQRPAPGRPPTEAGPLDDVLVRRWHVGDAPVLHELILSSIEHVAPWMEWAAAEPKPLSGHVSLLEKWEQDWEAGTSFYYAIFAADLAVGACGLHRQPRAGGLELGYWVRVGHTRRELATIAARLLTTAAFTVEGVDYVEVHHDKANVASGGVPRKLGYMLIGEFADLPLAPGETGIECRWRMRREDWRSTGLGAPTAPPGAEHR